MRTRYGSLLLVPALAIASCGGEVPDGDPATGEVESSIGWTSRLPGTYGATARDNGNLTRLVLMSDGSYHGERRACRSVGDCRATMEDGYYDLYWSPLSPMLALVSKHRRHVDTYQVGFEKDALRLRRDLREPWRTLDREIQAWCEETPDCSLQTLPPRPCAGPWYCDEGACKHACRPMPDALVGDCMEPGE